MRKSQSALVVALLFCINSTLLVSAQITGGSVHGMVRNQLREPVAGAKVTALNVSTNQSRSTQTDSDGLYRLPSLAVGTYEITVEAEKLQTTVQTVTLRVSDDAGIDVELLAVGSSEQANVVGTTAPITETSTSVLGIVIENKQITDLPLNGRNFLNLGTLVANVNSTPSLRSAAEGGARNGPFAVAGQRDRSLTFLVDGVDNTNSLSDSLSSRPSIESIQEFKMVSSLGPAEYGYHAGGTINIVTKSGSNDFHFNAFEYFRNDNLDAPNYFEELVGRSASHFISNQFGGTVSGPIVKDKTFFLANYEGHRMSAGSPQFSNVPTEEQRRGIFRNRITGQPVQVVVDPVSAEILRRFVPLPNVDTQYGNYFATPNVTNVSDYAIVRGDHLLSGDDILNARYYFYRSKIFYAINPEGVRFTAARPATIPGFALIEPTRTQNLALAHTHNFSVQTVNDLRFGYNRYYLDQIPENQIDASEVGFTGVRPGGSLMFQAAGMSTLGSIAYPIYSRFGNFHVSDSLAFMRGRHALKTGAEVRFLRQSLSHFEPGHGTVVFNGAASRISPIADFVMGVPVVANYITRSQSSPMRQQVYGFFVQDDYQLFRRFVVNVGVRYEFATVLNSPNHRLTNFSFSRGLFTPGLDTDTELYKGDHNNVAPRVGFAWSVTDDGRTVLRGGYGIFYDTIVHTNASQLNRQNLTDAFTLNSIAPRVAGRLGAMLDPAVLVPGPRPAVAYDENLRTAYAQHFNLILQREFGNTMVLSVGYVGSRGTKLTASRDINQAVFIPGTDSLGRPLSTGDPANINSRR